MPEFFRRYWLFAGDVYYACGGIHDLHATYATLAEATAAAQAWEGARAFLPYTWWHVIDQVTGAILAASAAQGYGAEWPRPDA